MAKTNEELRLIDADALKSKSELVAPSVYAVPYRAVSVDEIESSPTIEAEPVIHAHWIHETKENVWGNMQRIKKCSNCLQYGYKNKAFEFDFPYCPNCGADMRGGMNE